MVFQSFNLWSHMTVLQNVTEALVHVLKMTKGDATERAEATLNKVGMYDRKDYYPAHISGGQQQRAAIARALGNGTGGHVVRRADFRPRPGAGG